MAETDANETPGAFLVKLRENKDFWRWAVRRGISDSRISPDWWWRKCFDERFTNSPNNDLTDNEQSLKKTLISTLGHAFREYKLEKDHDFDAFLKEGC